MNTSNDDIEKLILNSSGSSMFQTIMLSKISIWKDFSLQFWLRCLEEIKNKPLCLYSYIPFAYKILGINLIASYWSLEDIQIGTAEYVNDALHEEHRLLYLSQIDMSVINQFGQEIFLDLINIKKRLTREGAVPVEKIFLGIGSTPKEVLRDDFFIDCYNGESSEV